MLWPSTTYCVCPVDIPLLSRVGRRIEKSACIIPVQPDNLHVWVVVTRVAASGPRCRWSLDKVRGFPGVPGQFHHLHTGHQLGRASIKSPNHPYELIRAAFLVALFDLTCCISSIQMVIREHTSTPRVALHTNQPLCFAGGERMSQTHTAEALSWVAAREHCADGEGAESRARHDSVFPYFVG